MNITVEIVKYAHDKYTVWTLEIQDAACDLMSFSSEVELKLHYGPRCGANTYIPEAASKSFTLNMPGVKMDEDKSIFWCQTPLKGRSPKFEMKVRGECTHAAAVFWSKLKRLKRTLFIQYTIYKCSIKISFSSIGQDKSKLQKLKKLILICSSSLNAITRRGGKAMSLWLTGDKICMT